MTDTKNMSAAKNIKLQTTGSAMSGIITDLSCWHAVLKNETCYGTSVHREDALLTYLWYLHASNTCEPLEPLSCCTG